VVGTRHPEGLVALHAPPANEDVLKRLVQTMAQMEDTRDVRGGMTIVKGRCSASGSAAEVPAFFPEPVEAVLHSWGS